MKRFLFSLFLILSVSAFAQNSNNDDEVVKIDYMNRYNAVEGELIVKFADNSPFDIKYDRDGKMQTTGIASVDKVLKNYALTSFRRLCPNDDPRRELRSSKSYNGNDVVERDLSKLCLIKLDVKDAGDNLHTLTSRLIDEFNEMKEVEFAEPNYIAYSLGYEITAETEDVKGGNYGNHDGYFDYKTYKHEPYYKSGAQWGIDATKIDELWQADENDNDERAVIAILDTGVDIEHPDLEDNIWTNPNEIANGNDDDGNGLTDDLHGYDFVNNTAEVRDYNSHGTHCAGIAAAVGDNGKGIVGANPNAFIMPVTVMQSNGTGSISTLIEGISYAKDNGADVISMSIGTYAYSMALEQVLAQAYQNSVLVAAAGNDGAGLDPRCAFGASPMYPAAFTFVLGVQATQAIPDFSPFGCGYRACFSNYDCDGPSFSQFSEEQLYNYELQAPGVGIVSTVPNGKYKYFNGTSMACPLVAGGISALLHAKEYPSQEMLWGDLINTSGNHVDFMECYKAGEAPAQLQMVTYELLDNVEGEGDADYRPDAGETIVFYPTLRTTWGAADNITYHLEFDEYEDQSTIEFIENDNIDFGHSLSAYAKNKAANPVVFKVSEDVVDGRIINLVLKASCPNAQSVLEYPFSIQVENGVELKGVISENTTLHPDVHYIVTSNMLIPEGITLTVEPGTVIRFKDNVELINKGRIIAKGEPGNMITFTKTELGTSGYKLTLETNDEFSYCIVEYANYISASSWNHHYCYETGDAEYEYIQNVSNNMFIGSNLEIGNNIALFDNCILRYNSNTPSSVTATNVFYNKADYLPCVSSTSNAGISTTINKDNFLKPSNNIIGNYKSGSSSSSSFYSTTNNKLGYILLGNVFGNTIKNSYGNIVSEYNIGSTGTTGIPAIPLNDTYLGSSNDEVLSTRIYDIDTPNSTSLNNIDASTVERQPSPYAHGIVWKVLVNGYDAQDEFEQIVPLGVGRHKFEIYFNRPMDKSVAPMVAMGVRPPYTQNAIAKDGSWNDEGTVYTVYLDLNASTVTDGLNRIYVANAQDTDFFEIPIENMRFNVQVSSAGSMSTGFEATAGIGKVSLAWYNDSTYFNDHLGWNMYRYQKDETDRNTDTLLVNQELITDTLFVDYDVVPGERYYYFYKTLRTNMSESDASNNVSSVPLTATQGDANGSLSVDVSDIVTVISYITGELPQPFVFGAADVNGDGMIDVMDIVGIINIITTGYSKDTDTRNVAKYYVEDGILYVDTPVELAGVQISLDCYGGAEIEALSAMDDFEQVGQYVSEDKYLFLAYSLSGAKLSAGKHAILRIYNAEIGDVILSDINGTGVLAVEETMDINASNDVFALNRPYPNPFSGTLNIPYLVGADKGDVEFVISNITGQQIAVIDLGTQSRGEYTYEWCPKTELPAGIYIVNMSVNGVMVQRNKVVYVK